MSESSASTSKNVLVVDDNAINRRLASAFLARLGYATDQAEDGPSALAKLENGRFDIVFLDISMPGMSGEEVLAKLRTDSRFNGLYVIAYTAHALPEEKQHLIDAGFDDLLIKPITMKAVEAVLSSR